MQLTRNMQRRGGALLTKIYESVLEIVESPDIVDRMRASGVEELITTRQEHAAVLKADLAKYAQLFSELKLTPPSE